MVQRKTKAYYKPWGELGEAKASGTNGPLTSSVLGQKCEFLPRPMLHHLQLADGVKAQTHRLRLGGLTPRLGLKESP